MGERVHNVPRYLHGTMDDSNVIPDVPLPLHAFQHYLIADFALDEDTKRANIWSVNKIMSRETIEEKEETIRLIYLHRHSK